MRIERACTHVGPRLQSQGREILRFPPFPSISTLRGTENPTYRRDQHCCIFYRNKRVVQVQITKPSFFPPNLPGRLQRVDSACPLNPPHPPPTTLQFPLP